MKARMSCRPNTRRLLTRGAMPTNFAATMQWIAVLGNVEDKIVECFHRGGGVHYEKFHRFHEVMAEESAQTVVAALTDHILPLVPRPGRDSSNAASTCSTSAAAAAGPCA